jgi:serine protease Do
MDRPRGALVDSVELGSPAEKAGIKSGDVITAVDGQSVLRTADLPRMLAQHQPGTHLTLSVMHDGHSHDVAVTLVPLEDEDKAEASRSSGSGHEEHSPALGVELGEQNGHAAIERVNPYGPADGKLRSGDLIEEINHQPVTSANDVSSKVHGAPAHRPLLLRVKRGGRSLFVAVEPSAAG